MKRKHIAKAMMLLTLPFALFACSDKNWPELSPLSEFENKFFRQEK